MHVHAALSQVIRQHDVADRLTGTEMNRLQRAERRAQHHLGTDLVAVERGDVAPCQAEPHGFEIHPCRGRIRGDVRQQPAVHVQRPVVVTALAERLEAPRGLRLRTVAEQLQRPGRFARRRVSFRVPVPKDHRAVQLAVLQGDRTGALAPEHPNRHRAEHCARHHHLVEHPVIVQPRGIRRADLGGEHHVAAGRVVPHPQQRMPRVGPAPLRRADPVPVALERVGRQRHPAPRLAGKQPIEAEWKPGLVRGGDAVNEGLSAGRSRRRVGWPPQARHRERRRGTAAFRLRPDRRRHGSQHRVRPDLHDRVHAEFRDGPDTGPKRHDLARLAPPVRRVEPLVRRHHRAREIAHERQRRRREGELLQCRLEVVQRRLHHRAVIGGAPSQARHPHVLRFQISDHCLDVRRRAADHLVRAVVRRDAQADLLNARRVVVVERRRDACCWRGDQVGVVLIDRHRDARCRREHRGHRALARQRPDQGPPCRRETEPVPKAQHPGRLRRRDLSQAVPQHDLGPDSDA